MELARAVSKQSGRRLKMIHPTLGRDGGVHSTGNTRRMQVASVCRKPAPTCPLQPNKTRSLEVRRRHLP